VSSYFSGVCVLILLRCICVLILVESAGVFAMVLECVPEEVAKEVTAAVSVPTIGIGAGPHTSGQVLVYHDLLGMMQHPHYAKVVHKYLLTSTNVQILTQEALLGMMQHRTTRRSCVAHALLVQKYLRTVQQYKY
jgi:hypothetical protein